MKKIGVWLDHRKAVILTVSDSGEEIKEIHSGIQKHIRAGGKTPWEASQEDVLDRQFGNQVRKFYGDILPYLEQAETIRIYGPGEAKKELEARLQKEGLGGRIIETRPMGKLTDRQVVAEIRRQLQK